jgi:hypothetical protein
MITFKELVEHHNGTVRANNHGHGWFGLDIEFPTLADGQHFSYAAQQKCWSTIIATVQHIGDHKTTDAVLYYVCVSDTVSL